MKLTKIAISFGLFILAFVVLFSFSFDKSETTSSQNDQKKFAYQVKPVSIPENIILADEKVPIENFDVKESLDKELLINTYWQSQTMLFIKRSHRYFPIIEPILKEVGIPEDFKYLALAESGLTNVVSPSNAAGYWQFLKGTAQDYGLEVNDEIDERYHIEKSTRAAAGFLKDSYKKYGSWAMAAASYNVGRRNLSKQIERQKSNNYYDLILGEETGRYVYRIIALKLILESPEDYGFFADDSEKYPSIPYKEIKVSGSVIHWANFAHQHDINYKTLKALNPWLRDNQLTNTHKKTYTIKIADKKFRNILPNPDFYPEDSLLIK